MLQDLKYTSFQRVIGELLFFQCIINCLDFHLN